MAETYHGAEIPDDLWQSWNDPNSSEVSGFRIGVRAALRVPVDSDVNWEEHERLESLADARDAAEQAAFEERNKDNPAVQNLIRGRRILRGEDHGTS